MISHFLEQPARAFQREAADRQIGVWLLAVALMEGSWYHRRPVTLLGYSLGARIVFGAMQRLAAELPALAAVVHCAAQASVVVSTADPAHDLRMNVGGTLNVLEVAAAHACPLVFTSTGCAIYGGSAAIPTPETSPVDPDAPYGASKAAAEIYIRLAAKRDGLPHTICRLGNVYGPRQRGDGPNRRLLDMLDRAGVYSLIR